MTNDATVDAGADTSLLAGGVTGMHPDQHAIAFDPFNPRFFFVGSDGGVIRVNGQYTNRTADCAARQLTGDALALCRQVLRSVPVRSDWLNDGLRTLQYQGVSLNPADPGGDLLGGTQDNGTWAFNPSAGAPGGFDAFESVGGDGGVSSIGVDQVKVHTYFGSTMDANFGGNEGDTDSPRTWDYISEPLDAAAGDPDNPEAFAFYVPLIHDPSPSRKGTLFTGGQFVWRTTDNGGPSDQLDAHCRETALSVGDSSRVCGDWQRIGRRLSAGATQAEGAGDYVVAVERAPSNDQTLWAGTRQGHLWISRNANAADPAAVQFTEVDAAGLPGRFPSSITIDPGNPNHVWVSYSGYSAYTPSDARARLRRARQPRHGRRHGGRPVLRSRRPAGDRRGARRPDGCAVRLDGLRRPDAGAQRHLVDQGGRWHADRRGLRADHRSGHAPALRGHPRPRRVARQPARRNRARDGRADTGPRRGRALRRGGDRAERRPQPRAGGLPLAQSTGLGHQPPACRAAG